MILGIWERKRSLWPGVVRTVTTRFPIVKSFFQVPSGELEDELYFKEGRFCNELSSLQYRQWFSTIRVNSHPSPRIGPWCLELDQPSRTYQKGTRNYLLIAMVRLIFKLMERNLNGLRDLLLTSSTPTQPQRTPQDRTTHDLQYPANQW